jgi:hypothetical protein
VDTRRTLGSLLVLSSLSACFASAQSPPTAPAGQPSREILQKLDGVQSSLDDLSKRIEESKGWTLKDLLTSIGGFGALVAALVAVVSLFVTRSLTMRTLSQKANEEKAKNIQDKLDQFYGPLVQLRNKSTLLYNAFKARQPDPKNFRTLTAVLSGKRFEGNDKVLLDEIIKVGEETETLIMNSSGLVDEDLQPVLGRATSHYTVLRLAQNGQLQGDANQFASHVFPRDLDAAIAAKVGQLKTELDRLRTID